MAAEQGHVHWRRSGMTHSQRLHLDFRRKSAFPSPDLLRPLAGPRAALPRELGPRAAEQDPQGRLPQWKVTAQRGPFFPPRNLLSNPFNCNCHLAWLGKWLRKRRIVSGNPRCQKPFFLKEIPIQDVAIQDFTCEGEKAVCRAGAVPGRAREERPSSC